MDYKKEILNYANNNNGIITTQDCKGLNIPTIYLTRLTNEGNLNRIDRGIYLTDEGVYDEYFFLQLKYRKIVYSHETALYFHELIDLIPHKITVSVPYSYKINVIPKNLTVKYIKEDYVNIGLTSSYTNTGNIINVYDKERTVIDIIINSNTIDRETYTIAIRNYIRSSDKNLKKLFEYSEKMKVIDQVRNVLEVLYI